MVITLDRHKKPLGHCTERRARKLISNGRACIYRHYPFTIIIKDIDVRDIGAVPEYRIKIDPGSTATGIAVVEEQADRAILYFQIEHRSRQVVDGLTTRRQIRRNRRNRETVYRRCRFPKKGHKETPRPEGWLPPSVKSTGDNVLNFVKKLSGLMNVRYCSFEAARFDVQLMENPDISGEEYQNGTLKGYELREYLLEKHGHTCQYCGGKSGSPVLEWEHVIPRSRGGSNRLENATLSCRSCNQSKGRMTPAEWKASILSAKHISELDRARLSGIDSVMEGKNNCGLRYAAWTNSARRYIEKGLFEMFGDVECSTGGRTKYNRTGLSLPKDHHYDALCVGTVPGRGYTDLTGGYVTYITAMGRGSRFRGKTNRCGIITQKLEPRTKRIFGFMNGDIVSADIPKGKHAGHHVGRVMTRASGSFDIRAADGRLVTSNHAYCRILQYADGYKYRTLKGQFLPAIE